ncbi:hypothetical protein [Actinoplanes sp. NPDC026619]|uniref:hypothetical protein n=1 Tax=Actinoplanes sp. NPDC026619 TaxID=3155798 RepID=UPI0033CA91D0
MGFFREFNDPPDPFEPLASFRDDDPPEWESSSVQAVAPEGWGADDFEPDIDDDLPLGRPDGLPDPFDDGDRLGLSEEPEGLLLAEPVVVSDSVGPREIGEAQADRMRWGELPEGPESEGPWAVFFEKAVQTAVWRVAERVVDSVVPGAGVLVRVAYFIAKYQAVLAALNDGRGAEFQVGVAEAGDLSLGFRIRLGADDSGPLPRFGALVELNLMDQLDQGDADAEAARTVLVAVTEPSDPWAGLIEMFGDAAVRDHGLVLSRAASVPAAGWTDLITKLRRRWVQVRITLDQKTGEAVVTVVDGYGSKQERIPLR